MECIIQGLGLTIANVYFPVRSKELEQFFFYSGLKKPLQWSMEKNNQLIIGGDFNTISNFNLDYMGTGKRKVLSKFGRLFENVVDGLNLIDIRRVRNGMKKQFTYRQINPFMQSRLDDWFVSEKLDEIISKCNIIPSIAPDHSTVQLNCFNLPSNDIKFKGSYWKFNNSLCKDEKFIVLMKTAIIELKEDYKTEIESKRVLWNFLKMKINSFIRKYSKEKAKLRKEKIGNLEI